jgi:plastocyanin
MRRTRGRLVVGLVLLALTVALAGCGGDDDDDAADTTETTTEEATDGATTEPSDAGGSLKGTVGPGFTITLTSGDGGAVMQLTPGSYDLEIEDLSAAHNFHMTGPGVDISTDVGEEGTQNVSIELAAGTYEFVCDPHAGQMNGSVEVVG